MAETDLIPVFFGYVLAAASPGPSNLAIMNVAMAQGRRSGLALAAGVVSMSAAWGLIAATGLAALLSRYAQAVVLLKTAGGIYLLWLALKSARSALSRDGSVTLEIRDKPGARALYRRGILMHLGNPKSVLTWLAIMSLGVAHDAPASLVVQAYGGCVMLGTLIFGGYAVLFSTAPMVRGYARMRRHIEGVLAILFAGAGIGLILSR